MKKIQFIFIASMIFLAGLLAQSSSGTVASREAENPTLITVHAEDAHLPGILSLLAKESGYNIVTDPNVSQQDKITIHLDNVPIEQAINLVVRAVGLSYEVIGNSFLVAESKKLKEEVGISSYVLNLKYANALEVQSMLKDITKQVQVDTSGNKLIINASPKRIAEIEDMLVQIDVPAIQIMLETRLIEVSVDAEEQLGLDWSKLASYTNILSENATPTSASTGVPGAATSGTLPTTNTFEKLTWKSWADQTIVPRYFSRQLTAFNLTLDLLLRDNKAEILANSRLTTLNGRQASIDLLDIVPYILSSGGVGGQVQVQKEEVGIKLQVLPAVNTDGYITVKVDPEVSSIFEFIGPDKNIPRVKSRKSSTTIRVKNGESIIIGGLLSRDKKKTTYRFPVLHRIPWLGKKLFTSHNTVERKTELIIQITPHIVEDNYTNIIKSEDMQFFENETMQKHNIDKQNEIEE
jgi:type II secretory pathway component GspD/PulD (secretin)